MMKVYDYLSPSIEIYTLTVEKGFADSIMNGSTTDYTENDEEIPDL